MKKLALVLVLALFPVGCCTADKEAAREIDATHALMFPRYLKYIEADPRVEPAGWKDDEKKLVESLDRLTKKLIKSVE